MKIRAKFRCHSVAMDSSKNETVQLSPVYADDGPNKAWAKYTPSGSLTMQISQEGAQGHFEPGKDYFLDITPADE